jgi:NADH:ubiquinone oxidoreductase subunit K
MISGLASNLYVYLFLSVVFFVCGLFTVLSRKNAVGIFMGIELMLNAGAINFVAFEALGKKKDVLSQWPHGQLFALFIIVLAAIEAAVALAIVLRSFALKQTIDPDRSTELRG